jgi:hypothetical protein
VIAIAVAFLATLSLALYAKSTRLISQINTHHSLAFRDADQIKGYSCGHFSQRDAEAFLDGPVTQNFTNYSVFTNSKPAELKHYDSCLYESKNSSTVYAQFFIETYGSEELAMRNFESHLPPVSDPVEKPGVIADVDRVIYDAGVYYVLNGRQVAQVAASNGTPSQSEQFAENLLKKLAEAI